MALVTPELVYELTRREVSEDEIAQAQAIVELEADLTEEAVTAGNVSARNLRLLENAVSWQAVWLLDHSDALSAMDVSSASQDGVSGQFRGDWAQYLAPLAKRAIDKLTWKTKPLRVGRRRRAYEQSLRASRDSAAHDDQRDWTPL